MMRYALLVIFGLGFFITSFSQEICNNGIDDDNDGLIDLNDVGNCNCAPVVTTVPSLIPNASFEQFGCVPSTYSQLNCATGWVQATSATSDFFQANGYNFGAATSTGIVPPPNGNGYVGAIFSPGYQEYVGACLSSPMLAGTNYTLSIQTAAGFIDGFGNYVTSALPPATDIVIYANSNCNTLPLNSTNGCPTGLGGWYQLASATYNPVSGWSTLDISFTPTANVGAIMIGSVCNFSTTNSFGYEYHYYDNLVLNTTSAFNSALNSQGSWCTSDLTLVGSLTAGATYQWYFNGVALVGQTTNTLGISSNNLTPGQYTFVTTLNGSCTSTSIDVPPPPPPTVVTPTITGPTSICADNGVVQLVGAPAGGVWSGNGVNASGVFDPVVSGNGVATISYQISGVCTVTATATQTITVNALPTPTLSGPLNYCAGDSVLISLDQAYAQMSWSGGQTTQQIYADDTDNPVSVTVTSAAGCVATVQLPPIVENISPIAAFTTQNECQYDALNFTNTSANSVNYSWDFGDGSAQTSIPSPNHLYNLAGTYTVTLIASTSANCSDTTSQTITVYAVPDANYSVQSVCQGTTNTFVDNSTLNSSTGESIASWNWSFGDGSFGSGIGVTHTYTTESVYTSGLVVTTSNGCMDTLSVPVTVWPLPQVNFSPTAVCEGFSTQFQDLSTISTVNSSNTLSQWSWNFGDGGSASTQNPLHAYTTSGGFTANLTVTSNHGCVGQASLPVTVHPKPTAQFSGNNLSGCSPICANLVSTSSVASGNLVNYAWSLNSGGTSTAGPNAQFCLSNTTGATIFHDATLIVTSDFGCRDTAFASNYIAVFHNPIADFSANPQVTDMLNTTIDFTNSSLYADSYFWSFGNGGTSSEVQPSVTYDAIAGSYTVDLVALTQEGCIDTAQLVVTVNEVLVYYVPNSFTPDGDEYNNVFQPVFTSGFDPFNFNLLIFNRWGEVIFESNNHEVGWDGTYHGELVKEGTYTWKIRFKSNRNDAFTEAVGHVSLIR